MGLFDAFGNPVGLGPRPRISQFTDPSRKIFEGPFTVKFYNDRVSTRGICFHCRSMVESQLMLTKAQARACTTDQQFRKNMVDLAVDGISADHQCGLLSDGKDTVEDLHALLEKESRKA